MSSAIGTPEFPVSREVERVKKTILVERTKVTGPFSLDNLLRILREKYPDIPKDAEFEPAYDEEDPEMVTGLDLSWYENEKEIGHEKEGSKQ